MYRMLNTKRFVTPLSEFSPGPAPFLEWIEIEKLVVDDTYQREIGRRGTMNVHQISEILTGQNLRRSLLRPLKAVSLQL